MSTLLFYNFKGGVGKTTISVLAADHLSRAGKKVLLIDLDAQASATLFLKNSYGNFEPKRSLYTSLQKDSLRPSICHLDKNLDLIPADWDMSLWNQSLEKLPQYDRNLVLQKLIQPLKANYDFVILDIPPTLSTLVNNAVLASDYIILVLQTQSASYEGVLRTAKYLAQLRKDYESKFKLLGIVLYLVSKSANSDTTIAKEARKTFGDAIFANSIYHRERVKRWSNEGLTHKPNDVHDRRTHEMYSLFLKEVLFRIGEDK
ncbi:MAG TPA: ParA family protein [Candidatus Limosilactobacillus intestinavium]|nr:ParA family protein [Candidatus Limosilactobacillus intestinavium]